MATTIAELVARIDADISGFQNGLDRVDKQVNGFGKALSGVGGLVGNVMKTMGAATVAAVGGMTTALVGVGASGIAAATDFESAFTGVIKTVDATDEQMAMLRQGILDMSSELPASASEIAGVAEAAGQLGIQVDNILGFTRVMSDLGVATNLEANEAATALARLANITGMSQTDFDRLGSTIVALGNNLATTEAEIVAMGLRIAGAGSQIGLTEAQILSFAGAMSSVGIEAEAGGSAISRVMIDMANAVANGDEKLEGFAKVAGMSASQFAAAFRQDAAGALISFIEGLDGISRSGGNVFGVLEELELSEIRVRDTLLRASGAGDLFRNSLELGSTAWEENNALTREAELRYSTMESRFQLFRNAVDAVRIGIGDKLLPIVGEVTAWATEMVKRHGPMVIDFFGRFAEKLTSFATRASGTLERLTSTFSLNFAILGSENASFGEKLLAIWDMVAQTALKIWQGLADQLIKLLPQWLERLGEWALSLWEWIKEATPKALENLWEWAKELWGWLVDNAPIWAENLWEWAKELWEWIVEATPEALNKLGEWGSALITYLSENLPNWITALLEWGTALWTWIGTAIPDAINGLAGFIAALRGEGDGNGLGQIGQMVYGWAKKLWTWITEEAMPQIAPAFTEFMNAVVTAGGQILLALGNLAAELGRTLWHWITIASPIAFSHMQSFGTNLANTITNWVPQFGTAVSSLWLAIHSVFIAGSALIQGDWERAWINIKNVGIFFWGAIEAAMEPIQRWLDRVSGGFLHWKDILVGAFTAAAITSSGALGGLLGTLGMFVPGLNLVIAGLGSFLSAAGPFLAWFALATAASAAFRLAWENDWLGIRTAGTAALGLLGQAFGPLFTTIQQFGWQALQEIWAWATGTETSFEATNQIIDATFQAFGTLYEGISQALTNAGISVAQFFQTHFPQASSTMITHISSIGENFQGLVDQLEILWTQTIGGWDTVVAAFQMGKELLDGIFAAAIIAVTTFSNNAILILTMVVQMLNGDWKGAWETAQQIVENTLTGMQQASETILNTIKETFGTVFSDMGTKLAEWGALAWDWFKERFPETAGALTDAFDSIKTKFGELWDAVRPLLDRAIELFNQFVEDWSFGSENVTTALGKAQVALDGIWAILVKSAETAIGFMIDSLTVIALLLTGDWKGAWETAEGAVIDVVENLEFIVTTALDTISDVFGINLDDIVEWYNTTRGKISEWWSNFATQIANRDWQGIYNKVMKFFEKSGIKSWYDDTTQKISGWWDKFKTTIVDKDWYKYGRDVIQGLWNGMKSLWTDFSNTMKGWWQSIPDSFANILQIKSPSRVFWQMGVDALQGLEDGLEATIAVPLNTVKQLATDMTTEISKAVTNIDNVVKKVDDTSPKLDNYYKKLLDAKIAALELASQPILPDFTNPELVLPPVLTNPNGGSGGNNGIVAKAPVTGPTYKELDDLLRQMFGRDGIAAVIEDINNFAAEAFAALTAPGQAQLQHSSAAYQGYKVIDERDVANTNTQLVIQSISALIAELRQRNITKIDPSQMEALIEALRTANPNLYGDLVGFTAGMP